MAKVTVAGKAVVITSSMKLEDLKLIQKFGPEALILMGGEDNKEPIFAIDVISGGHAISKYGISFCEATRDDGYATLTTIAEFGEKDPAEFIADYLGLALRNLNALEETLPAALEKIRSDKKAIMDSVTVLQ